MKYKDYYWTILPPMIKSSIKKHCGKDVAKRAIQRGMGEIMETLCGTDWLMFRMQYGVLHRECTLAAGQLMCDYWVVGDQIKDLK